MSKHILDRRRFLRSAATATAAVAVGASGTVIDEIGWVASDYLGIDQGPILAMIENYRSGLIWKIMQKNPHIRRGLTRAGFSGGWLGESPQTPPATSVTSE